MILNAKIIGTSLGFEGHGIFSYMLTIEFESSGQGFGGYRLDQYIESKKRTLGTIYGCETIIRILRTLEVERWESLVGAVIRVKKDSHLGKILEIGHYLKDKWFNPELLFEELKNI